VRIEGLSVEVQKSLNDTPKHPTPWHESENWTFPVTAFYWLDNVVGSPRPSRLGDGKFDQGSEERNRAMFIYRL
jgi:hypothetical protein